MTPLEHLKALREKYPRSSNTTFEEQRQQVLNDWLKEINDKLAEDLIKAIERHPGHSTWIVSIPYKTKYRIFLESSDALLKFVQENIKIPDGFLLKQPLSVTTNTHFKITSVKVVLDEIR